MKYRLVEHTDGKFSVSQFDLPASQFIAAMQSRGFTFTGLNTNPHQRLELQGEPRFSSLCGPMWDGDAVRYENQAANDVLST